MELRQAIQAFRNAEAAGDVEAASRLARFIDQNLNQEPQPAAPAPEEGILASGIGGFKRFGAGLETAVGSIIDPQGAAQRGLQRQQELSEQYAPGASLDRVKQAYEKSGLLSAAGEAISQVPSALAEQFPNIAATIAGGKAGAMAGTAIAPGIGTVVGGLTGAAVPSLLQLYGSNLVRQAEETPQDISRLSALGAAVPGTALEVASTAIPLGRTFIGKILGPEAEKMLARGTNASLERAAKESVATSLVRGGGVGALAEIPTEVTQQMLERLQAGLPLTTDDALAEYAEAAYGATLVGTPFGAIARTAGRSSAQQQYAALKQQEDARLAVSEEELAQRFPETLPGGFKIEQEELGREMGPQGYNIMAEGREQPLSVVNTEEEAAAKLEALTKIRAEERENLLKEEQKINAGIQKAQQNLERLEATEQTDTDEYRSLKAQLPTMMDESAQKIKDTYDKIEALSKPLSFAPFGEVERVNSQFKLFGPDSQQVGVFKTREQAEGAIEQSIGEDTFKQAKENQAAAKELYKTFVPQMRKFGLGDVGLNIVDRIENGAGGAYLDKLIRVSLEDSNPVQTMRHESLHALKDLGFFTPQQWKALERQAKKTWIQELKTTPYEEGKSRHDAYIELFTKEAQDKGFEGKELDQYVNDSLIEESIADAFGAYDKGAKPPPGMIAALYRKIKSFFANLSQALRGAGFQSADDIFQAVERGELKPAAKAKEAAPKAEERRSLRKTPEDVSGKIKSEEQKLTSEKTDEQLRSEQPVQRPSARGKLSLPQSGERREKPEPRAIAPLAGAPSVPGFSGPIPEIVDAAERYARQNGIPFKRQAEYVRVNPERAKRIAEAYEQMPHAPNDPAVRAAYKDLVRQTTAQYKALVDAGYKFWFMDMSKPDNQEYASTPWNSLRDLKDNKQMGVFPTNDGFGSNEDFSAEANPLLAETEFKWPIGGPDGELQPVLANDLFRAVHDAFGHGLEGAGFRADGEENAWQAHVRLFTGPAVGAITSETRGQNSWLNFGPYGEKNRTAKVEDTTFADQKTGLMPEWTWTEGLAEDEPQGISLGKKQPGAMSFKGSHYGNARVEKLDASKYGTGLRGAERRRLDQAYDDRIKKRVYFYIQKEDGSTPIPEAGVGSYVYTQQFDNILPAGAEMSRLFREARGDSNDFESNVIDAGYDGYAVPSMGMMVILNHNVPVNYVGPRAEVGVAKLSLRRTDTKEFKDWFGDSKVVDEDGNPLPVYHGTLSNFTNFREAAFFSDSPKTASNYADQGRGNVMPVYLRLENPYYIDAKGQSWRKISVEAHFDLAKERGHDGIIVENFNDNPVGTTKNIATTYVAFSPEQIKSATGNIGTYGQRPVTAEEAKRLGMTQAEADDAQKRGDIRYSLKAPTTPAFKLWFGDSKVVNKDGTPMVMYHGLAKDTTDFTRKTARGAPIFLTDDPDFAAKFAADSYEAVARNPEGYLSKEQIADGVKRAIAAIKKDYGKDSLGKEMIESLQTGDLKDATPEAREYIQKELINLLPTGPHIMPLYVRAENPFDYDNPSHVRKVVNMVKQQQFSSMLPIRGGRMVKVQDLSTILGEGNWETIEAEDLQEAIKALGFDSFYVKEHGRKNLAVYEPNQVKSATGNVGTYSLDSNDVRYSLRNVAFPTAKEATEAADAVEVPDTIEFKRYIAGNQWVDEEGKAKKFYHATTSNFFEFNEGVIYLSDTAEEAEKWGRIAEDRLREQVYRALNKDEKLPFFQKAVDEAVSNGKITEAQGERFMRDAGRKIPEFGSYDLIKKEMDEALLSLAPDRMKIMPLYARAVTPFDFRNKEHVQQVIAAYNYTQEMDRKIGEVAKQVNKEIGGAPTVNVENILDGLKGILAQGYPKVVERPDIIRTIRKLGFDGYITRRNRNAPMSYAVFKPEQVKSITGNDGKFSPETKDVRYSLPSVAPQINARVDMLTTAREQKGFAQRMIEAISPKTFSSFRQSYLNRYEQLSRYDKLRAEQMGGAALLADQSAESAALMSDLASGVAASAMGYGDRNGGVPVYRNGTTVIDRSVKGLIASLAPLAKYGDPKVYQYYQFWAGAKRAERLMAEGRERLYTQSDFAYARTLQTQFPEFVDVQRDLIAFNNGIVNYMVQTQVLSPEMGRKYTEHADYIPFYRQMEGERTSGPNIFSAISGVRPPKKLKGGDTAVADLLENLVRNTQSSIEAGMKNAAANRAIKVVSDVVAGGNVPGVDLVRLNTQETGDNIINVLENGKLVSYKTTDKLLVEAVGSLNMSELPFMGLISGPSNLLRNLVTKDPGFMMANLIRDSLSAYVTSGQSMTPIAGTMANFAKALARKSPGYEALLDAGVIGGYELSQNVEQSGESLARDLDKKAGKKDPILMRPFTSLWNALETGTTASDAATRAMVYERVLAETGNEAEALYRALEVMNFNRKGNSPLIRVLTAAVPFFNARLQGLDLFYRASTGNMNTNDAKAIQRKFFLRGSTMMALSVMYYMMVADDEEYKKQEQETKDGNWIIPSLGIRIPIPFEVGVLFKTMPERITAYALGNDTGKDLRESTVRNLVNTFAFNPIPQTVKPIVEAATNFSFFTMRPIVGQGMGDVAPEFQVGPGTSKVAEMLGRQLGMSPMKIDHILKGYTGTMGVYMVDATDLVMEQFGDSVKANKRFEQLPIIKRFALDPEARGTVTAYYELKDAVDTFTRTSNLLEKTSKPEDFVKYVQKNAGVLGVKDYVLDLEKEMKELREMRRTITSSSMDGEQKKNLLTTIGRAEQNLTSNIQTVKKVIASVQ